MPSTAPARPLRKDMPSIETHNSRSSDSRGVRPKYYPNRGHQCRYPVLVEHIPRNICWQELKDFGRLSGLPVAYCEVDRLRNGRGFIEYLSRDDAEDAARALNGQKLGGQAVSVRAHSSHSKPRRSSRSRSPRRRPSHRTHDALETIHAPQARGRCASQTSAPPYYSLPRSPEIVSSQDTFTSQLYSNESALPIVLHPEFHTFSRAVESCRTALFGGTVALGSASTLQTSFTDPVTQPAESNDYYNQYLLSYDRNPLEYLPGCFS
ncbi:hypothetical protein B0H17DRAFT_273005 [Mycena rosella]|uniref:RRM domain-containing protein n=1 Tax=Mycena rosella TaxID=1033263 RepID=A0AAD7GL83_MYCRO|nr:hypothetical protein B0H17DRAFT_273005 [Mycena rosella]